jgi:integrase
MLRLRGTLRATINHDRKLAQETMFRFLALARTAEDSASDQSGRGPQAVGRCRRLADAPFCSALPYGCGLRAGEVVRLKVKHIDSAQRIIRIEQGKGRKDRNVMLSPELLDVLRQWAGPCLY